MFRQLQRRAVRRRPFPDAWLATLRSQVAAYMQLGAAQQAELQKRILVFIKEKTFEGCLGLEVSDTMRVVIAAQACLLELGRRPHYYPDGVSIFIYPSAFVSTLTETLPGGMVARREVVRIGEAWRRGSVVLAWDATLQQSCGLLPGHSVYAHNAYAHNVTLHEFAHKLDGEDGSVDGVPDLGGLDGLGPNRQAAHATWAQVMSRAYRELVRQVQAGELSALDPYGATNPAEFFAVATETFFASPLTLKHTEPDLYKVLSGFYGQDPANWPAPERRR
ncbi:M90 family metallopeptidase [Deinococcus sp.]|uniref:M90 family metallopeptidase n=1 Tax=Deinococcus sp. TaxID=47478 RepID=UPI0025D8E92D|nr:M90 family metallopeptidase [Deinococcus sp.]